VSSELPPFQFCTPITEADSSPTPAPSPDAAQASASGSASGSAPVPQAIPSFSFDSLENLVRVAISKDNQVISQQQLIDSAAYALRSAKGNWWPTVSMSNSSLLFTNINAAQNYSGSPVTSSSPATAGKSFNPFNGSGSNGDRFRRSKSAITPVQQSSAAYTQAYPVITLQWNFIDPGRYPQIAAARKQVELARSQAAQTLLNRKDAMAQNIAMYLLAGIKLGELNELLSLQNQLFNDSSRRVSIGLDPRLTRAQQYRNLLNVQSQIVQVKTSQSDAGIQLQQALINALPEPVDSPPGERFDINALIAALPLDQFPVQDWPYSLNETISRSLAASPNLQQLQLQAGIAIDNANLQKAADLPTIGLLGYSTYQYTWGSQNYQPPTQPSGAYSASLANYFGLSVSWNIFNGHIYRNQAISYRRQADSFRSQVADTRNQVIINVRALHRQLSLLKQQINLGLADYKAATAIASDMQLRAQYKLNTSADQLQARADVHQSRLQLISSIAQYLDVYAKLSVATGVPALAAR
jgi:outer membrane protein TolC